MKVIIKSVVLSLFILLSCGAQADSYTGAYVFASGGVSTILENKKGNKYKESPLGVAGAGYHFNEVFRSDVSLQYRGVANKNRNAFSFKDSHNYSVMWNAYINLTEAEDDFRPYLTAGVGYGRNEMKKFTATVNGVSSEHHGGKNDSVVWNAGVGAVMNLSKNIGVDFGYRYVGLGDIKGSYTTTGLPKQNTKIKDARVHELSLGVVINL